MRLTILSIGFPLAAVTPDPVGGAEQVLTRLDRALVAAGHRSIVIAPEGSVVAGELVPIPAERGPLDDAAAARAHAAVREATAAVLARERIDVIHLHGLDFDRYLPPPGPPVLVTLHLPLEWYGTAALTPDRPQTHLHPVSAAQAATAPPGLRLGAPIENGVTIPPLRPWKRRFALALGRICPEKGFDDALDAAALARVPMVLAGQVFAYPAHEAHFREAITPRLGWRRRWVGLLEGEQKDSMLAAACCVLIPSRARETSSLVAMEALAAGTPVIAYPSGALVDIVEHGRTGFLVEGVAGMAAAIGRVGEIDPAVCREQARERFSAERMIAAYLQRYVELAG